jgi:hypothetical protein
MIHVLHGPATDEQLQQMQEVHESYIKVAVDVKRRVLAGGGEFHADCESALIEDGSQRSDVWGADWLPQERVVRYAALINIRPQVNRSMEIEDPSIRGEVEAVVRALLERR